MLPKNVWAITDCRFFFLIWNDVKLICLELLPLSLSDNFTKRTEPAGCSKCEHWLCIHLWNSVPLRYNIAERKESKQGQVKWLVCSRPVRRHWAWPWHRKTLFFLHFPRVWGFCVCNKPRAVNPSLIPSPDRLFIYLFFFITSQHCIVIPPDALHICRLSLAAVEASTAICKPTGRSNYAMAKHCLLSLCFAKEVAFRAGTNLS